MSLLRIGELRPTSTISSSVARIVIVDSITFCTIPSNSRATNTAEPNQMFVLVILVTNFFFIVCCSCSLLSSHLLLFNSVVEENLCNSHRKKVVLKIKTSSYPTKNAEWATKSRKLKPRTSRIPLKSTSTRNIRKYLNLHSFFRALCEAVGSRKKIMALKHHRHLNAWTKRPCSDIIIENVWFDLWVAQLLHFGCVDINQQQAADEIEEEKAKVNRQ